LILSLAYFWRYTAAAEFQEGRTLNYANAKRGRNSQTYGGCSSYLGLCSRGFRDPAQLVVFAGTGLDDRAHLCGRSSADRSDLAEGKREIRCSARGHP
jgi:hypothetical protein